MTGSKMQLTALLVVAFVGVYGLPAASAAGDNVARHLAIHKNLLRGGGHRKLLAADPEDIALAGSLFAKWNAALATLDPKKVAALYSPGAVLLPTVSNIPRNTHELIEDYFHHFLERAPKGVINRSFISRPAYHILINSGIYTFTLSNPAATVQARYTYVYELIDNEWYIKEHHSSAMPEQKAPDAEDIAGLFDTWNAALATLDPKKVAALYTKDAVLLPTVSNKVRNTPALIEDYFVHFLEKRPQGVIDSSTITILSPTLATRAGVYTFTLTTDGVVSKVQARYSYVYRKEGGKWLIAQHHSSAMPEQQLPTEAEIHQLFVDWNAALQTKNPETVADMYATGSILLPTLSNLVTDTREEKLAYFSEFLKKSPVGVINEEHIQILSPTLAANSGIYTFTLTTDGKTSQVPARYTYVYSKIGGEWKIIDHHSSLMPEK